jgi:hypothetical protein
MSDESGSMNEADRHSPYERLPPPPPHARRVRLHRAQWIGIPLLTLVPVLALTGLMGDANATNSVNSDLLSLVVDYPALQRVGQNRDLVVEVRNRTAVALDSVVIRIESGFLDGFEEITSSPSFDGTHQYTIERLSGGERRTIRIELTAARPLRQSGRVTAVVEARDSAGVVLRTFVFP